MVAVAVVVLGAWCLVVGGGVLVVVGCWCVGVLVCCSCVARVLLVCCCVCVDLTHQHSTTDIHSPLPLVHFTV